MLLLLASAQAASLVVDPSGSLPDSYPDLDTALAAASDGDTLALVAGDIGPSTELNISGLALTLQGAGSAATTVQASLILEAGAELSLQDLSLAQPLTASGGALVMERVAMGGGETCLGVDDTRLELLDSSCTATSGHGVLAEGGRDVVLQGFSATGCEGAGARLDLSSLAAVTVTDSLFDSNADSGLQVVGVGVLEVRDSHFSNNRRDGVGDSGGGLFAYNVGSARVEDSFFEDNYASQSGGGAFFWSVQTAEVSGSSFERNVSDHSSGGGGALYLSPEVEVSIQDCSFVSNTGLGAGALWLEGQGVSGRVSGSSFEGNEGFLGGAAFPNLTTVVFEDSIFIGNAAYYGGAIYRNQELERCDFVHNTATSQGGALSVSGQYRFEDLYFEANSAPEGGAIWGDVLEARGLVLVDNEATEGEGGAIYLDKGSDRSTWQPVLEQLSFVGNRACTNGGGLAADRQFSFELRDSRFLDNEADTCGGGGYGGGLYLRSHEEDNTELVLSGLLACGNSASAGGGLYVKNGEGLTLENLALLENTADEHGGGAWLRNLSGQELRNSVFLGNEASSGGGLYVSANSELDILDSVFAWTVEGDGLLMDSNSWSLSSVVGSAFYDNTDEHVGHSGFDVEDDNLEVDPGFEGLSLDGDCSNDALWLASDSELAGAGSDGGDIGVHGGDRAWSRDADGDGFDYDEDCDDHDADAHLGADELCGGWDEDCDGEVDEDSALDASSWYLDADGDGYGEAGSSVTSCQAPSGYVASSGDCDDGDAGVHPEAEELCDGLDQDCDGELDEEAVDASLFYVDADGDGVGTSLHTELACGPGEGLVEEAGDCDDSDPEVIACDTGQERGETELPGDPGQGCGGGCGGGGNAAVLLGLLLLGRRRTG